MRTVIFIFRAVALLLMTFSALAQDVIIPDPGLNTAVRETLQKLTGPLTQQDLLSLTNLEAQGRNISGIEGLEAARNLVFLNLQRNSLTNFSFPGELTNLVSLDLSFNALTQCSFPGTRTSLTNLDVANNQLESLSFPDSLSGLASLNLEGNQFTSFNFPSNLTGMASFDIGFNSLTAVTFPSGLTNLTTLNVAGNQLTNLTLPCDLTALDAVDVHINQIANFSLPGDLTSLSHFDIDENQLNSFSVPASLTNLVFLDLSFNSLTNLSLPEDFTNLAALDLDFNQFTALELPSNLTGLKELHLRSNQLTNFVLPTGMIALAYFDIGENQLRNITLPAGLGGLATIRISGNTNLTSLTLPAGMTNLTQIFLRSNQLTNFTLSPDLNRLATIDILGNQLTSLTLPSGLTNLTELALSENLLTNLTLPPDMTQLSWLVLNGNPLTTLVLSEPLASTSLSNTVASLRSEGVSVFTYPLEIQVIRPRQLLGAFQFAITGPPGVYKVMDAADLTVWSEFDVVTNSVGTVVFNDAGVQFTGQKFYKALRQDPPAKMIFIRPCTFNMGSPDNEVGRSPDEGPQTLVTLNRGFWMSQFLVTQQDYLDVIGSNPSGFPGDLNRPVESVTWLDATNYCVQLTKRELAAGRIPPRSHYRLPTEAEWECAARAGTATRFNYGDDPNAATLANYAWYGAQGGATTHPVGLKQPNAWGLYDMEGNVWEWCQDWYGPYSGGSQTDPQGPASSATGLKVIRGGAWESFDSDCRSARRMTKAVSPFISDFIIGFRVVLTIDP